MRVLLDTSAINWLADNPGPAGDFFAARDRSVFETLVTPEAAKEVRDTKNPARRAILEAMLSRFFPLTPTRVPRFGAFRFGLARISVPADTDRLAAVGFLRDGQDKNLAANAGGYRCEVFLTRDHEMAIQRRVELEAQLGGTRVLKPEAFIRECCAGASSGATEPGGST